MQLVDAGGGQHLEQRLDGAAHLAAHDAPVDLHAAHPGTRLRSGTDPSNVASTVSADRWRMLGQGPDLDQPPSRRIATRSQSASTSLKVCEERRTVWLPFLGLVDAPAECLLHQRVEAAGRLVEDEQLGPAHQCRDQDQLLAVPLRVGAHLLGRVEVEAVDQLVAIVGVDRPVHPAEQMEGLGPGQRRPQVRLAGDVGEAPVRLDRLAVTVEPEDLGATRGRADEPEQEPDGGGLPGAVRSEVADDLARPDLEVEVSQRIDGAVALGEALGADRGRGLGPRPLWLQYPLKAPAARRVQGPLPGGLVRTTSIADGGSHGGGRPSPDRATPSRRRGLSADGRAPARLGERPSPLPARYAVGRRSVPDAPDGGDPTWVLRVGFDLQAHPADVLGHRRPALPPPIGAPHPLEQLLAGEDSSRRGGEEGEQVELLARAIVTSALPTVTVRVPWSITRSPWSSVVVGAASLCPAGQPAPGRAW